MDCLLCVVLAMLACLRCVLCGGKQVHNALLLQGLHSHMLWQL